jgi:hypothetical protein
MNAIFVRILVTVLLSFGLSEAFAQTQPDETTVPSPLLSEPATGVSGVEAEHSDLLSPDSVVLPPTFVPETYDGNAADGTLSQKFVGCCDSSCFDPAGYKFSWGPDKWAKVGAAVKGSFNSQTYPSPGIGGNYFTVNNARLLTSGQVTKYMGFELNADVNLAQSLSAATVAVPSSYNLLDAIVKLETGDLFNIWAGQFLPPSDRSNIDGPFFINGWDFPFVANYPAVFQGRQIGAAYWGQWAGGQVKWSVGAFNGTGANLQSPFTNPPDSPPGPNNNLQFDARVTINFLDPEPGYYHQSSYFGQKDIFAVGFALQSQKNAVGTAANPANFLGLSMDVLFEKKLASNGVVTVEGALYRYNDQDLATSSRQGDSGFVYLGYLLPYVFDIGPISGRWRPFSRYQQYNRDFLAPSAGLYSQGVDAGVEYVMNGPNARVMALWSERNVVAGERIQLFTLGAEVVF